MMATTTSSSDFSNVKAPNWNGGGSIGYDAEAAVGSFRDLSLSDEMLRALDDMGYQIPTAVQASCVPLVIAGIDLIVQSQTGTGKTAAFAIPTIELLEPGACKVQCLVLMPTRELAKQVAGEFERLASHQNIPVATVYGGTGFQKQYDELETAQIVCATPGRLLDLLKRKALTLDDLQIFILDEADEMLNMGFEEELTAIVSRLPSNRQALLFSATVTEEIKSLASHILQFPEFLGFSGDQVAAAKVEHVYYSVSGLGRLLDFGRIIEYENPESAICFCNTKSDSFLVANFLKKRGYSAEALNGDLPQAEREKALGKLRDGNVRFLVATDVAARGIDISDLSHVLNFALPDSPESYIHRTGRTGRIGKTGIAISLIAPREIGTYYLLRRVYKLEMEERELPSDEAVTEAREQRVLEDVLTRITKDDSLDYGAQLTIAERLLAGEDAQLLVARLLAAYAGERTSGVDLNVDEVSLRARPAGAERKKVQRREAKKPARRERAPAKEDDVEEVRADTEDVEEVRADTEDVAAEAKSDRPRRGRRRDSDHEAEARTEESEERPEATDSPSEPQRRRRRRRSRASEDETPEAPAPVEASADGDEEDDDEPRRKLKRTRKRSDDRAAPQTKLHLNIGSNRLDQTSITDLISDLAELEDGDIQDVTMRKRFCYVEVRHEVVDDVIRAVTGHETSGVELKIELAQR
jgi:ATP-dependent RNA helicase DeaD